MPTGATPRKVSKMAAVCVATMLLAASDAALAQEERLFAAHALAFRSAVIDGTGSTTDVLATIPGARSAQTLPLLWRPFFENAIVKLGRVRAPAPVALYYNPLVDVALVTVWQQREAGFRIISIRALPGERLDPLEVSVPEYPGWLEADDLVAELASTARSRLSAFRWAHPAEAPDVGDDAVTFRAAAADMRAALPRLTWLFAVHARWVAGTDPWLIAAVETIDETLAVGSVAAVLQGAPDTDSETAAALAQLPLGFVERLTLDLTLDAGGTDRLLVASSIDDGDIYIFVSCKLDDKTCALRRFVLLSLSGLWSPG